MQLRAPLQQQWGGVQPPHYPGRLSTAPDKGLPGSASRAGTKVSLPMIRPPEVPRAAARDWIPPPTAPGSRKDPGSAKRRGLGSPALQPRGARRDGALPWRRPRRARRPAPLGVAGGPTGPGLSDPTARRRPRRDQDGGRRGSGMGGRKLWNLPSHRSLSRSGRGEEMAPEAKIELPACLA